MKYTNIMTLLAEYQPEANSDLVHSRITESVSESSNEPENKFIEHLNSAIGYTVPLSHYGTVKQVIMQNIGSYSFTYEYIDNTTGDTVIGDCGTSNEFIVISDPRPANGIILLCGTQDEETRVHIVIHGELDV